MPFAIAFYYSQNNILQLQGQSSQSCNQNIRVPNERYGNLRQIAGDQNRYNQYLDDPFLGRKKRSTYDEPAYQEPNHGK